MPKNDGPHHSHPTEEVVAVQKDLKLSTPPSKYQASTKDAITDNRLEPGQASGLKESPRAVEQNGGGPGQRKMQKSP